MTKRNKLQLIYLISKSSISQTCSNHGENTKAKLYSATIKWNQFTLNNSRNNNSVNPFGEKFVNAIERLKSEIYLSYYNGESNDTFVNFVISNMVHMY